MKIKPHRPRSCLGWMGWVFGILLVLFAISYSIDMVRLTSAWNEAYTLAAQLGYTPEHHLTDKAPSDINIVPVFGVCKVQVFFTTPLDALDFAIRLEQVTGPLWGGNLRDGRNMYLQLPFTVNGRNTLRLTRSQTDTLPLIREQDWYVGDDIFFFFLKIYNSEFSQANVKIEYGSRPIKGNVVYVSVEAGMFPIWTFVTDVCARSKDMQRWMR